MVLLAAAPDAMGRVRRLGLVGLMGVEKREDRPFGLDELAGQAVGLGHHFADLRVGLPRGEIAGADRAEPVHLMDDHEARGAPGQGVALEPDRQLRCQASQESGGLGHGKAPECGPRSRMSCLPSPVKAGGPAAGNPGSEPAFHSCKGAVLGEPR